jgi:hypothetical protein
VDGSVAGGDRARQRHTLAGDEELAASWDPAYGDRINKVVFVGIDMNHSDIVAGLDRCLLTEEEMMRDWGGFSAPFPRAAAELADTLMK